MTRSKVSAVRNTVEPAASDGWDKALEKSRSYLDRVPEVRETLEQNATRFTGAGVAAYLSESCAKEQRQKVKEASEETEGCARS